MTANLQTYKVQRGDGNASSKFNALVQAIEDLFNAIPDNAKNAFAPGNIFDLAQLMQGGASVGDILNWNGTDWAKTTPGAGNISIISDQELSVNTGVVTFTSIPG